MQLDIFIFLHILFYKKQNIISGGNNQHNTRHNKIEFTKPEFIKPEFIKPEFIKPKYTEYTNIMEINITNPKLGELCDLINRLNVLIELREQVISRVVGVLRGYFIENKVEIKPYIIEKYIRDCYTKWIFDANYHNTLDDFLPTTEIVLAENIDYFCEMYNVPRINIKLFSTMDLITNIKNKLNTTSPKALLTITINKNAQFTTFTLDKVPEYFSTYTISNVQKNLLIKRYRGNKTILEDFTLDVLKILVIYRYLNTPNELLSLPPKLLETYNVSHEGFGSPLNTTLPSFSSAWPKYETIFGSRGSYFDLVFEPTHTYTFSPPADLQLMNDGIAKMLAALDATPDLLFIVDVPIWDPQTQAKLGMKVSKSRFIGVENIFASKYLRSAATMSKDYKFYDYFRNIFIPVVPTHVFILSNRQVLTTIPAVAPIPTAAEFAADWLKFCNE